jgi:hypothetical protein
MELWIFWKIQFGYDFYLVLKLELEFNFGFLNDKIRAKGGDSHLVPITGSEPSSSKSTLDLTLGPIFN